ncbi:50S ribosomal protein L25 [Levilinea saccharolytica]|nr:50S ribosomal protein L25 [Levilinea saccharolytica]
MEKAVIKATRRTVTGKKVGAMRREGKLPGVIYGHHLEPIAITMDQREASRTLATLTSSSLVNIELDGQMHAALVREKQKNYIRGTLLHVDFLAVSLTEKIRASVAIEIHGVAPAVKDYNGVVINGLESIEVESLPQDLPERVVVDISELKNIGDGIYVRDLKLASNVIVHTDKDEMIVVVTGGTTEETIVEGEATMAEPEVIEKGKKEEEVED